MAIDMRRPLFAAIQAALDEVQAEPQKKRHGVGAGRALLLGAGLYTAGRVVARGPGRGMLDALQQRLPEQDSDRGNDSDDLDEEFDEEEPEGEAGEDFDDEAEEEPEPDAEDPQTGAEEDEPEAEPEEGADQDEPRSEGEEDTSGDEPSEDADEEEAPARQRTRGRSKARSRR